MDWKSLDTRLVEAAVATLERLLAEHPAIAGR
jgi:hypothetical protein